MINKAGLNLKKGEVKFSIDQDGLLLKNKTQSLKTLMADLLDAILKMEISVSTAPGKAILNPLESSAISFKTIQTRFNTLLKD